MSDIKPTKVARRNALYDRLHRITVFSLIGVGVVTAGLLGYNLYLFKKEGVPMLINKYRKKIEEQIELKQREAEYLEYLKKTEQQVPKK